MSPYGHSAHHGPRGRSFYLSTRILLLVLARRFLLEGCSDFIPLLVMYPTRNHVQNLEHCTSIAHGQKMYLQDVGIGGLQPPRTSMLAFTSTVSIQEI